ncbi:MAG: FAD-dependent oxidoreductase [Hyphomonadaceae bacterium]
MRIAVIGSGISGLSAAWALRETADVTVFEARDRIGGHSCTLDIDYDGTPLSVDVGFIVYNALNYPNLIALFEALGVETQPADMSFAVSNPNGYEWSSNPAGLLAWKRNLLKPRYYRFLKTILRFNDIARQELADGLVKDSTLRAWLERHKFNDDFIANYIRPMGAAIWSTPQSEILDFPALSFFQFFENHRLMHRERPNWRTVSGGSRNYVGKLIAALEGKIRTNQKIVSVRRIDGRVGVKPEHAEEEIFDHVIMAGHSDQSLAILDNSFEDRRFLLKSVRYRPNEIYLHRDTRLMPKRRAAWAAWNVLETGNAHQADVCLSYWMNILQGLPSDKPVFVTLNPSTPPAPETVFSKFSFDHPQFDLAAEAAVRELRRTNGDNGLWLAGAWMGSGFHEDGLKSGLEAALSLGGSVPWEPQNIAPKTSIRMNAPPHGQAGLAKRDG